MSNEFIADAPLYCAVQNYAQANYLRFHTPGHSGHSSALGGILEHILSLDVTELPETDSLFEASGVIRLAEEKAAKAFGSLHTLFSAGGATLCIQTMLRLVSAQGKRKILCARGVHRSVIYTMALLNLEPIWIWPTPSSHSALLGPISSQSVYQTLTKHTDAAAVFLTSPDYYGTLSDISAIHSVCQKFSVPLLVDCAHGTHLHYLNEGKKHPLAQGADLVCDSAHKTLPVLTGGAFLQIGTPAFSLEEAKAAMSIFGSSSPSYLILLSLDLARAWGEQEGVSAFSVLQQRVHKLFVQLKTSSLAPPSGSRDPIRITLDVGKIGLHGDEAASFLHEQGISIEMADQRYLVLLPSVFHSDADFEQLRNALLHLPIHSPLPFAHCAQFEHPERVLLPGEALRLPHIKMMSEDAANHIAADSSSPCPPGIPLLCPGERITPSIIKALQSYGITQINVLK